MKLSTAISLIRNGISTDRGKPQTWADLGAGSGLFSKALAELLPDESRIYAVDRDGPALSGIQWPYVNHTLTRLVADVTSNIQLPALDGALLGNVLHFLPDQTTFVRQIGALLNKHGVIIVIEYDTDKPSPWIPYPVPMERLSVLATAGRFDVTRLSRERSKFNAASLYSAVLHRLSENSAG